MTPAPTHGRVCRDCKYSDGLGCHRYPPQVVLFPTGNQYPPAFIPIGQFPQVSADEWCGEWAGYTKAEEF